MLTNQKQRLKVEDDLLLLATLGLLEIEGRELIRESKALAGNEALRLDRKLENKARRKLWWQETADVAGSIGRFSFPIFSRVAVFFFTIFLALNMVLIASADARAAFYNLLLTVTERYTQVEPGQEHLAAIEGAELYTNEGFPFAPAYLPPDFPVSDFQAGKKSMLVNYNNDSGQYVVFLQQEGGSLRVDSEAAEAIERMMIGTSEALLVEKDGRTTITWQVGQYLLYIKTDLARDEAILIAENIRPV